jgi:hypothetical protein
VTHPRSSAALWAFALLLLLFVPAPGSWAEDTSLSAEDYVLNGVPDPGKRWKTEQLVAAANALADIGLAAPEQLPRIGSERSGEIFERMTSHDVFKGLDKNKVPVELRLQEATTLLGAFRTLAYVYLKGIAAGQKYDMEMATISGFALGLTLRIFPLLDELGRQIPMKAPDRAQRIEGIITFKSGLNEVVAGALGSLGQDQVFDAPARAKLALALERFLPGLLGYLPPIQQTETRQYLQMLAREESNEIVRASIKDVLEALPPE